MSTRADCAQELRDWAAHIRATVAEHKTWSRRGSVQGSVLLTKAETIEQCAAHIEKLEES